MTCSGVSTWGIEASAPSIGSCVEACQPLPDPRGLTPAPPPLAEARSRAPPPLPPAELGLGLHEMHGLESSPPQGDGALHPGGPRTHDQHSAVGVRCRLEPVGVPPAAGVPPRPGGLGAAG